MHSLYSRHPNGPFKTHTGTRRARPRSVFNVRLFNGNLESFIKVLVPNLTTLHCLSSYLFSDFLWLSGQFGGFPKKYLSFDFSFTSNTSKQKAHVFALDGSGTRPYESVSSGCLCMRCKGRHWWIWRAAGGEAAVGGINVCVGQLHWLTADLAWVRCSGRDTLSSSAYRARAEASEKQQCKWQSGSGCQTDKVLLPPPSSGPPHCLSLVAVSGPAGSCPFPNVYFGVQSGMKVHSWLNLWWAAAVVLTWVLPFLSLPVSISGYCDTSL